MSFAQFQLLILHTDVTLPLMWFLAPLRIYHELQHLPMLPWGHFSMWSIMEKMVCLFCYTNGWFLWSWFYFSHEYPCNHCTGEHIFGLFLMKLLFYWSRCMYWTSFHVRILQINLDSSTVVMFLLGNPHFPQSSNLFSETFWSFLRFSKVLV